MGIVQRFKSSNKKEVNMINNFFGGVNETPVEPISTVMGCLCHCDCNRVSAEASMVSICNTQLKCQPLPFSIFPWPIGW